MLRQMTLGAVSRACLRAGAWVQDVIEEVDMWKRQDADDGVLLCSNSKRLAHRVAG